MQNVKFSLIHIVMTACCVSLLSSSRILNTSARGEPVNSALESQTPSDLNAESDAYKEWYLVFQKGDATAVIRASDVFLKRFRYGKYSEFVQQIRELAEFCVKLNADVSKREAGERLRSEVNTSLAGNADELKTLIKQILTSETPINTKSRNGATALMFAALAGDRDAVWPLINKNADANFQEETNGWTALIYAIWSGDDRIVNLLRDYQSDLTINDKEGRTAWDHAKATADFRIMFLIYNALEKVGRRPYLE